MARLGPWPFVLGIADLDVDEFLWLHAERGGKLAYRSGLRTGLAVL